MPVDPMAQFGMSRGRQAPAVSPVVSPRAPAAAPAPAVSPRATPAEVALAALQQQAESDAMKRGQPSFMISDDYKGRIAEYKRTHGL